MMVKTMTKGPWRTLVKVRQGEAGREDGQGWEVHRDRLPGPPKGPQRKSLALPSNIACLAAHRCECLLCAHNSARRQGLETSPDTDEEAEAQSRDLTCLRTHSL